MFYRNAYNEVIVTTVLDDGYYSMPLGIRLSDNSLIARVFKGSRLYDALSSRSTIDASICITLNPLLFYYAVIKKESLKYNVVDDIPCIKDCDACIGGRLKVIETINDYIRALFEPHKISILNPYPRPYVRGSAALIEALVHYTKIPYIPQDAAERLFHFIEAALYAVERSTNDPTIRNAIREIYERAYKLLFT